MEEIRSTSITGGEKGVKPARFSLLPMEQLAEVAEHYAKGAEKYAEHNMRKGYEWSKSFDALMRHATQFWAGEDFDEETGSKHLAAVVFHALTLMEFMETHLEFDDRYKRPRTLTHEEIDRALDTGMLTARSIKISSFGDPSGATGNYRSMAVGDMNLDGLKPRITVSGSPEQVAEKVRDAVDALLGFSTPTPEQVSEMLQKAKASAEDAWENNHHFGTGGIQ